MLDRSLTPPHGVGPRARVVVTILLHLLFAVSSRSLPSDEGVRIGTMTIPLENKSPPHDIIRDWHWPMMHDFDRNDKVRSR